MHCGCTRPLINTPPRHKDNALKLPRTSGFTLTFRSLIRIRPRVPPLELPEARLHPPRPRASLPSNVKNSDRPHLIHSHAPAASSSSRSSAPFPVFPSSVDTFVDAARRFARWAQDSMLCCSLLVQRVEGSSWLEWWKTSRQSCVTQRRRVFRRKPPIKRSHKYFFNPAGFL